MGSRIATKLVKEGHDVVVWNRSPEAVKAIQAEYPTVTAFVHIQDALLHLTKPRVVWMMLPAGEATEEILVEVERFVQKDDIIIDGANSKFSDTETRFTRLREKEIKFLGIGVSGGVIAGVQGYPMMVGGDKGAYEHITPILDSLAKPHGGHEYFGTGGAGHFVKMVHNGIEYPYMQAIGEGFGVLANAPYNFDLVKVAKLYQKGTLISGFMIDRAVEALEHDQKLEAFSGIMGSASGETVWVVEEAEKQNLLIDVTKRSLELRRESQTEEKIQKSFAAKMVQALRLAFGGHSEKTI